MTLKRQLLELQLGEDLSGFVAARRRAGIAWRPIAAELTTRTGTRVSHELLRSWFAAEVTA